MADRIVAALVVSNVALVVAVVALALAVTLPPTLAGSGTDIAPPRVDLAAGPGAGPTNRWQVTVQSVSARMPLWRFSVVLFYGWSQVLEPPVVLMGTGNLWISLQGDGLYLNFTDADGDGNLSPGDHFLLDRVRPPQFFSLRLLWAANQSQIQHATFFVDRVP